MVATPSRARVVWGTLATTALATGGIALLPASVSAAPTDLFISEYIEGSSNNKAIEIFNGTGAPVDLTAGAYSLQMYFNGAATAGLTINLTGTVAPGDVYVVAQASTNATILAQADLTSGAGWFNGDDAVVLRRGADTLDVVGQIGVDPGTEWGAGLTSTADNTLRRKAAIEVGDANGADAFDPAVEWDGLATDTFDGLGANGGGGSGDEAPAVVSTVPAAGASGVDPAAALSVTFSEPVTVGGTAIELTCSATGDHSVSATGGPTSFTLQPTPAIAAGEACTLRVVATQVADQDAEDPPDTMAADVVVAFDTNSTNPGDICAAPATPISTIQGSGATSPSAGSPATVRGVVVGDYQGATGLQGFYVQEEDADADADPATSEGIFVFQSGDGTPVSAGDVVTASGTVTEFASSGSSLTELGSVTRVTVCGSSASVTPPNLAFPVSTVADFERYEGMLVRTDEDLTVTETFTLGRFGEVALAAGGRLFTPTAIAEPGAPAQAQQQLNDRNRILLDDANGQQNRDPVRYPEPGGLSATNTLRSGDIVPSQTFVMDERFGEYRLQPVAPVTSSSANPRPAAPPAVGGDVRVGGAFNVLNYFNGDGAGGGFPTRRGATTPEELTRQRAKIVSAIAALDADVVGLMELENDAGATSAIADLVAGLNDATAPGTYAAIDTGIIGTDEIKVGLLYQPAVVSPVGAFAVLDSTVDPRFIDTRNRPSLAQTFEQPGGGRFTVVVNHLKSKGSGCEDIGDPDTGDGSGNCNVTRTQAAEALVDWIAADPTGSGDGDVLVVGDLNTYAKEDPIDALGAGGFVDLVATEVGAGAYSYVFDGQSGYLDHALASAGLATQVTGVAEWHINADEPIALDYNTEFKSAGQINSFYAPDPYRASDHDPVIVGLDLDAGGPAVALAGPYQVAEGKTLKLTATGTDPDGGALTYTWDLDGDGTFESSGATVTFDARRLDAPLTRTVTVRVTDTGGAVAEASTTVTVVWAFSGFLAPIHDPPAVNRQVAGLPVTLRFRLGGFQGTDPAATPPTVQRYDCTTDALIGTATPPSFVGPAPLYLPLVRQYSYTWSTPRAWRGTCATFALVLADGTSHTAELRFI